VNIEIRQVSNGFIMKLSGDANNRGVKAKEKVAGSVVEAVGLIAEHMRETYGEDGKR
jgi:hypothetical protein